MFPAVTFLSVALPAASLSAVTDPVQYLFVTRALDARIFSM